MVAVVGDGSDGWGGGDLVNEFWASEKCFMANESVNHFLPKVSLLIGQSKNNCWLTNNLCCPKHSQMRKIIFRNQILLN